MEGRSKKATDGSGCAPRTCCTHEAHEPGDKHRKRAKHDASWAVSASTSCPIIFDCQDKAKYFSNTDQPAAHWIKRWRHEDMVEVDSPSRRTRAPDFWRNP